MNKDYIYNPTEDTTDPFDGSFDNSGVNSGEFDDTYDYDDDDLAQHLGVMVHAQSNRQNDAQKSAQHCRTPGYA